MGITGRRHKGLSDGVTRGKLIVGMIVETTFRAGVDGVALLVAGGSDHGVRQSLVGAFLVTSRKQGDP